jgi:hypothetical protein
MSSAARSALVGFAVVLAAGVAAAQQRLGDIAGTIRIQRTGEDAVIDQRTVEPGGRPPAGAGDAHHDRLAACVEEAKAFRAVLREAFTEDLFLQYDWRGRSLEAATRLEVALRTLLVSQPRAELMGAWNEAMTGVDGLEWAVATIRASFDEDSPQLYMDVIRSIDGHIGTVETAMAEMRRLGREGQAVAPPADVDVVAADEVIARRCGALGEPGTSGYDSCAEQQRAALAAIQNRFTFSYNLDEPTFNRIRNDCALEFPNDLSARDACERRRMDAAGRAAAAPRPGSASAASTDH